MESKRNWIIAGAGAALIAAIGIAYFLNRKTEVEEEKATEGKELTLDDIKSKMLAEIEKMKSTEKKDGTKLSQEYILNIFYILTKYTALAKICEDNKSFEKRIEVLKSGNDAEYEKK